MTNEILARAKAVANSDLASASAVYEKVSARQQALGATLDALNKYIAAAEDKIATSPSLDAVASKAALDGLGVDPAVLVNTILNAVEAARAAQAQLAQNLTAMQAAKRALLRARDGMHAEAHSAHQRLVAAQSAMRPVAVGARDDATLLAADDLSVLSSVEKARLAELHARAARYVEAA